MSFDPGGLHCRRKKSYSCDRTFMESSVQHCFFFIFQARNKTREAIDPLEENPIPTVSCLLLLASVIIIANIATSTMYVSKANKMKKKSLSNLNFKAKYRFDYPILALLFSNILQGLLTLPAYAIKKWKLGSRDLQGAICGVFRFSYFLYLYLSILISSLSTFDQLMLLKFPFQYRKFLPERRIFISIIVIVLFSLLYDTLPLLPIAEKAKKKCTHIPFKIWSITNHMIQLIFLIILIFNTIWLTRIAYQQTRVSRSIRRGMVISTYKKYEMIRLKATKTVVIMIATYIFCWGPLIVYYLIVWLCKKCFSANYMAYDQWTRLFVKILAMLYALLSPIIFGARNNLFTIRKRKEVKTFTAELKPLQI